MPSQDVHCRTTCCWLHTRRRTRLVSKVSHLSSIKTYASPTNHLTEAALDANAPIEDDDDPNAGPVDSDEEYNAVMSALKNWNPQPVVPQPQLNTLKRETQLARLRQQLDAATDHGRKSIFKVKGWGAQRLPPGHPGHRPPVPLLPGMDQEDADGEDEDVPMAGTGMPGSARSATFAPIRQMSVAGPV